MRRIADTVIIGGGVIGSSIAYHLAKMGHGRAAIVLEKDQLGFGSTGKCAGGIRQQFSSEVNVRLSMSSLKFFEHFEERTGYPAHLQQNGYLILASTEEEMDSFSNNVAMQRKLGLEVYLLSVQEVKALIPQLNVRDVRGATYCLSDGFADPSSVVLGFSQFARRRGVSICEHTEVIGIEPAGRDTKKVMTNQGEYQAPIVIDAAGAFAGEVARMVGLDIPIRPSRRHIFFTEPVSEVKKESPMTIDLHNGFWFRKEGCGLIFGMRNPKDKAISSTSVDWNFLRESLAEVACDRLPLIADVGIANAWAGLHADTPDFQAILGRVPEIEGFFLACGFSGHGFMHSPAVGKLMAEIALGREPSLDVACLSVDRFTESSFPGQKEKVFI